MGMSADPVYDASPHGRPRYDYSVNAGRFRADPAMAGDRAERAARLPELIVSPHWQDRVRAEAIIESLRVTLPDDFPCIVEAEWSPNLRDGQSLSSPYRLSQHVWVAHPDDDLLHDLLPEYQAMWDACVTMPRFRRVFAIARVSGVDVGYLRLPDSIVDDILRDTSTTHRLPLPARLR
jgi:hypothetical protein